MCRLLVSSQTKIKGIWLETLTLSQGGDGEGFIVPDPIDIEDAVWENINGFWIGKRLIKTERPINFPFFKRSAYKHSDYYDIPWLFYHTRLASVGRVSLENCHPAVSFSKKIFLMQNGTEHGLLEYADVFGIDFERTETDHQLLADLADKYGVEILLLTDSNYLLVDSEEKNFYVIVNRTMTLYEISQEEFIIASEPISIIDISLNQNLKFFTGYIEGKIDEDRLRIEKKKIKIHQPIINKKGGERIWIE